MNEATVALPVPHRVARVLLALLLLLFAAFLALALLSFDHHQVGGTTNPTQNLCRSPGGHTAHLLVAMWGLGAFLLPLIAFGYGIALLRGKMLENLGTRLTAALLLLPVICGLLHLLPPNPVSTWLLARWNQDLARYGGGLGGALGNLLTRTPGAAHPNDPGGLLTRFLDTNGALLFLLALLTLCVVLLQLHLVRYTRRAWRALRRHRHARCEQRRKVVRPRDPSGLREPGPPPVTAVPNPAAVRDPQSDRDESDDRDDERARTDINEVQRRIADRETTSLDARDLVERIRQRRRELDGAQDETNKPTDTDVAPQRNTDAGSAEPAPTPIPEPREPTPAPASPTPAPEPAPRPPRPKPAPRLRSNGEDYSLPDIGLLEDAPEVDQSLHQAEVQETGEAIEEMFKEHRISVRVAGHTRGPVITQYELELLESGLRVNRLEGFEKDLALKLGCEGIRIVAPLPNKRTVGVEVPNQHKEAVVMRDLVDELDPHKLTLPLVIGRDVLGTALVGDLNKMPHLLIAGATGMGKSVCLNAIICSLLLFRDPDEIKFIMVDPKQVELAGYEGIPHLLTPPITDMTKAHAALEWACREMDERFYALRLVGARDIGTYNRLGERKIAERLAAKGKNLEELPGLPVRMHYTIIVVDEYADLMMVNKEVEKSLVRLTAKARACGIHVILTTQRPSADVVTGLIKSNLPCRICFRVADKSNSRVVLDSGGAENLLGRGDMLFLPPGSSNLIRGQGVWVKDHEIDAIVDHARSQGEPEYDESICKIHAVSMAGGGGSGDEKASAWLTDRQFHEAVWSMFRYNKTGADFLRRKLGVGYNKATQYVELMEDLGILGPAKGTKAREFLKGWEDWLDELTNGGLTWDEDDEIYTNPVS
ncbi:MAG: DNA translocase FtsK [Planctomycetota bacterium]